MTLTSGTKEKTENMVDNVGNWVGVVVLVFGSSHCLHILTGVGSKITIWDRKGKMSLEIWREKKWKTVVSLSGRIKWLGNLLWLSDRIKAHLPYAVMNKKWDLSMSVCFLYGYLAAHF